MQFGLVELLNSRALGNIALLLAAIIGVVGNLWLYYHKRNKEREILRQSLFAEIQSMEPVIKSMKNQNDVVTMDPLDPRSFLVDSVYSASSDSLGLLTQREVENIVEFYSTATSVQRIVDDHHSAYEQVARRELLLKAHAAMGSLQMNGDFQGYNQSSYDSR